MTDLRPVAIIQGVACMAGVIAEAMANGNRIAAWLAIVSLGAGFCSTTVLTIDEDYYWIANWITIASIALGLGAVLVLLK